jgi:hypothetical protein
MEEDARRAGVLGKKNWTSFPKSMYFARAISDAGRTYAPEIFGGLPMYTSEELGLSETTEDGGALPLPIVPPPVAEQPLTAAQERLTQAADPIAEFEVQFRNSDKFGRLRSFQVLKEKLKAVLGDTEGEGRYYELLGMSDVKHSNQFTTLGSALICAKLMLQQLLAAEAAANLNEELAGSGDQHE